MKFLTSVALLLIAVVPASAQRILLTQEDNYFYVRSAVHGGSDSNDCLSQTTGSESGQGPCETIGHVVRKLQESYDFGCRNVIIKVMDAGNYEGFRAAGGMVGQCEVEDFQIVGDTTPGNWSQRVITSAVSLGANMRLNVYGFRCTTAAGTCFSAEDNARLEMGQMDFGPVAHAHMATGVNGRIKMVGNYEISGGGVAHVIATRGQIQLAPGITALFTQSTPVAFSYFVLGVEGGLINISYAPDNSASGTRFWNYQGYTCGGAIVCATGHRFGLNKFSTLYTGAGAAITSFIPGTITDGTDYDAAFNIAN